MENPVFQMSRERINIPSQNCLAPAPKGKLCYGLIVCNVCLNSFSIFLYIGERYDHLSQLYSSFKFILLLETSKITDLGRWCSHFIGEEK